jgi:hypothetical protein
MKAEKTERTEIRALTAEEIDAVTGGLAATFAGSASASAANANVITTTNR